MIVQVQTTEQTFSSSQFCGNIDFLPKSSFITSAHLLLLLLSRNLKIIEQGGTQKSSKCDHLCREREREKKVSSHRNFFVNAKTLDFVSQQRDYHTERVRWRDCIGVIKSSVTRFGQILPFGQDIQSLGQFSQGLFTFWEKFGPNLYVIGHVFVDVNGQMLKNNLAIWSHCCVEDGQRRECRQVRLL